MAHPYYLRKAVVTGEVQRFQFDSEHFSEAGFRRPMLSGVPLLEAHQLVNKWNMAQAEQQYIYALE